MTLSKANRDLQRLGIKRSRLESSGEGIFLGDPRYWIIFTSGHPFEIVLLFHGVPGIPGIYLFF